MFCPVIKNKPPFLLLPPRNIHSNKFLRKVSLVKRYDEIKSHKDIWFKTIVGNKFAFQMSNRELPFFIRSIRGLRESYNEFLFEQLLYLEGLSDFPKMFISDDLKRTLEEKYNFYKSPYIPHDSKEYVLLHEYDLKDRRSLRLRYI